jgi:hypothetical protein
MKRLIVEIGVPEKKRASLPAANPLSSHTNTTIITEIFSLGWNLGFKGSASQPLGTKA